MNNMVSIPLPTSNYLNAQADKFIKLLVPVDGRDKLYKTIQYTARTAYWITSNKDSKHSSLAKLAAIDSAFSDARRAFRLGGFVREYKELMATSVPTTPMGVFKYISNAGSVVGEVMDLIIWLAKLRVVTADKERWDWWRSVLWMINILYTLSDQFLLFRQTYQVYLTMSSSHDAESRKEAQHVKAKLKTFNLTFIRYIADFFLCSAQLKNYNHKGYTGLFGIVSGGAGVYSMWKKL